MKKSTIAIVGNTENLARILDAFENYDLTIYYQQLPDEFLSSYCRINNLSLFPFREHKPGAYDLTILFECYKIIPESDIHAGRWLNIHSGILPEWRGASSNSWALLANEPQLGLSIHELSKDLDAGPILDCIRIENDFKMSYSKIKSSLLAELSKRLPILMDDYIQGTSFATPQNAISKKIHYTRKMLAEDGIINDFKFTNQHFINLSRLFIHANRSDLFIRIGSILINILTLRIGAQTESNRAGKLLESTESEFQVTTLDGSIFISVSSPNEFLSLFRNNLFG